MSPKEEVKDYLFAILGTFLFAFGFNVFIIPEGLYNGGFLGFSQIITIWLTKFGHMDAGNVNISGIIYYMLNIPLFILAFRKMGRRFFIKTMICGTSTTLFLTIIPCPTTPLLEDILSNIVVGGIISGYGTGLTLRYRGSGGGQDVLGLYCTQRFRNFSVGKLTMCINAIVYGICFFMFDITIVIYSVIFMVVGALMTDRVHIQNINSGLFIFSNNKEILNVLHTKFNRSATVWEGKGAYSGKPQQIIYTVVSKYEANELCRITSELDPHAFVVMGDERDVRGNFEKHL